MSSRFVAEEIRILDDPNDGYRHMAETHYRPCEDLYWLFDHIDVYEVFTAEERAKYFPNLPAERPK